jgi:arylsulfatase A-like enzyme
VQKPQWAVRQGDWKLIANVQAALDPNLTAADKQFFLSNLATDISEKTNHAAEHPEIVERLRKLHDEWFAKAKPAESTDSPSQDAKGNEK